MDVIKIKPYQQHKNANLENLMSFTGKDHVMKWVLSYTMVVMAQFFQKAI